MTVSFISLCDRSPPNFQKNEFDMCDISLIIQPLLMVPISQNLNQICLHFTPGQDFPSLCSSDMLSTIGKMAQSLSSYILSQCYFVSGHNIMLTDATFAVLCDWEA